MYHTEVQCTLQASCFWRNSTCAQKVNNMIKITLKFIIYMSNLVDCPYSQLNLRKLNFWPDDLYRPRMTLYERKSYISENYMKNWVEWHLAHFNLKKFNFWPDDLYPTLDDFVWWKIIHIWNLYEKSSWMIPCTVQTENFYFWPFLTFTNLGWLCKMENHTWLKTIWEIKLNDTLHNSIWKKWFLTFLDLYRPWMTLYDGKSYISEN